MKHITIAIDGPSGAGKSSMARRLSARFGFVYVDTGALYRAVGYAVHRRGFDYRKQEQVEPLLSSLRISLRHTEEGQRVFDGQEDVSELIRTPEMSMAASAVSAMPSVRAFLFDLQQKIAEEQSVIMDGRDIGTVVLPGADLKIFLTASDSDRAHRRYEELLEKGQTVTYEEVLADLRKRDYNDSTRAIAPLKEAADAVRIDTTGNSVEQTLEILEKLVADVIDKKEGAVIC